MLPFLNVLGAGGRSYYFERRHDQTCTSFRPPAFRCPMDAFLADERLRPGRTSVRLRDRPDLVVDILARFVDDLRAAGVRVGLAEHIDARQAIDEIGFADRMALKHALGATMAKSRGEWTVFETVFALYFSSAGHEPAAEPDDHQHFVRRVERVVANGDVRSVRSVARELVRRFGGLGESPVGVNYHLHRTLRRLEPGTLPERAVVIAETEAARPLTPLETQLAKRTATRVVERLREEVEDVVRRRVGLQELDRAPPALLPTEVDFRRASSAELDQIRAAIQPLARRLAARLASRRGSSHGRLDFRTTVRRSLTYGGVPVDLVIRDRQRSLPELVVLADVSRSVADFSRFTLQLVYALSTQFARVRSFVFIEAIEEVTDSLRERADLLQATQALGMKAGISRFGGHSDYGRALEEFLLKWGSDVGTRTTVIVLGDGRNNHHASRAWALREVRRRARRVYWLNPEPVSTWDTGDSIVGEYATFVHEMVECRNLGQLERFVERCC